MGARERNIIADKIRELNKGKDFIIERGQVKSVDESSYTMDVETSPGVIAHNVRLIAVTDSDLGVITVPKVNSHVVLAKMEDGVEYVLLRASEIDKWLLKIGSITLAIDKNTIQANGGNNKGLVKVVELTKKINAVENDINTFKSLLNGILTAPIAEVGMGAPSSFQAAMMAALATWKTQTLAVTQQSQIEDTKFTH